MSQLTGTAEVKQLTLATLILTAGAYLYEARNDIKLKQCKHFNKLNEFKREK